MTDKVFGPNTNTQEVYDVAGQPVVKAAMGGVNGMFTSFSFNNFHEINFPFCLRLRRNDVKIYANG